MLKGHTKIELTDVNTGEKTVIEEDNLVTNAVQYLLAMQNKINNNPSSLVLPIVKNALGGLMLFDRPLAEDPENICFPGTAHLVGYGDRGTNTSDTMRGSLNAAESGPTAQGYVSVWDFSTSQGNGTIQSLALTSAYAGANPILRQVNGDYCSTTRYIDAYQSVQMMAIQGDFVYIRLSGSRRIVKGRFSQYKIKVGEYWYSGQEIPTEFVTDLPSEMMTDSSFYKNGYDGYIYHITKTDQSGTYPDYYSGNGSGNAVLNITKIKYSDGSFDVGATQTVTLERTYLCSVSIEKCCISGGYLFWASYDGHGIYIINLSNFADIQLVPIGDEQNISVGYVFPTFDGGVSFQFSYKSGNYTATKCGLMYCNGDIVKCSVNGEFANTRYNFIRDGKLCWLNNYDDYYNNYATCRLLGAYLGTINNLSSPVVKLPTQTMKVTYTLNDIQEA